MTLTAGTEDIPEIYHGDNRIIQVYYGNELVWQTNKIYLDSSTDGSGTVTVTRGFYNIIVVGAGGGSSTNNGGAGAYINVSVYFPSERTLTYTIGKKGSKAAAYCRNNNGTSGGSSSLSTDGLSIVCSGGRYGCGSRNGCGAGYTYSPTYSISVQNTVNGVSSSSRRRSSWYGINGQGGNGNNCDEYGNSDNATNGYILIQRV